MDDGTKHLYGFRLHTDSYSEEEVKLLVKALQNKFGLNCSYSFIRGKPVIYIFKESFPKFKLLVEPYFHSSMLYKLDIKS